MLRVVCGIVLTWALIAITPGAAALSTPQRAAAVAPVNSSPEYKPTQRTNQRNYLAMIGPAPLRFDFKEQTLPPEPVLPEHPPLKLPVNTPESAQKSADTSNTSTVGQTPSSESTAPKLPIDSTPPSDLPKPVSILPDDTKTEIRPEDVLPFFRFPGASDSGGPSVPFTTTQPRGSTAPPSSATYRQQ